METFTEKHVDSVTEHYLIALFWSETTPDGDPLDDDYGPDDMAPGELQKAKDDCREFLTMAWPIIEEYPNHLTTEQIGHDIALTRNGHGAGFWDRGLGELGDRLTAVCDSMGAHNLYPGDDNLIYSV